MQTIIYSCVDEHIDYEYPHEETFAICGSLEEAKGHWEDRYPGCRFENTGSPILVYAKDSDYREIGCILSHGVNVQIPG